MRILQGSNEEIKSTFYVPKNEHQKSSKNGMFGHYVQTGLNEKGHSLRLDIMSRRNQIKRDMDSVWTKCPNRRKG